MQIGDQWSCTLLGGIHGQQRRDIDGDGWTDVPGFRRGYVRPRFFWSDERGRSLFFTVGWVGEDREGGTVRWGTTPTGRSFPETLGTRRADAGLVGHFLVGRDRLLVLKSSFSQAHHDLVFGGGEERDRRQFGFLELSLSGSDGHHTWVAGAAAERDAYRAEDLMGFDYTFTAPAVFLQDEFEAVRWLAVSASARADFHSAYGTFLNGRLSALIRPARGWSIRLSAGTGYSIPVPLTEETEVVGLSRILPLSDVAPERARGATADVGWSGGSWEVNGTLFGSTVEHPQILLDTSPEPGMLEFVSAATPTRTYGGEILVRFKHGNSQAIADYTYVHSVGEDSTGTGPVDFPLTPWHAAELAWIWEKEGKGRLGVEVSYTGRQRLEDDPYREVAPQYLVANVLGEIRVANAAVFLNAINLTDVRQSHYDPLVRPTQAPDGRWTTDPWAPLEGRMFNVGVRWEF
jgi:iron complex outermembrane receptor protein